MMRRPENGIYIVMGEIGLVATAMKRSVRWSSHSHHDDINDPLVNSFLQLKDILNTIAGLDEIAPNEFLSPFLEVIRSEDTTGPITGLALTSINKFLAYALIDEQCDTAAAAIENIADAVTHARFVGTDPGSDEVVLMKILHVLRTLMLSPAGRMLTNESVCEIMQSCFRICFEMRLSELLRKSAENILMDMVQLLFSRLPHFKEDPKWASTLKRLMMKASGMDASRKVKKKSPKTKPRRSRAHAQDASQDKSQSGPTATTQQDKTEADRSTAAVESKPEDAADQTSRDATQPEAAAEEALLGGAETIATTPVACNKTVVDLQNDFQEASDNDRVQDSGQAGPGASSETIATNDPNNQSEPATQTIQSESTIQNSQQSEQSKDSSIVEQRNDKTHQRTISLSDVSTLVSESGGATPVQISLHVDSAAPPTYADVTREGEEAEPAPQPQGEESSTHVTYDHNEELDRSIGAHSEGEIEHNVQPEYVNPRGVRFTPHIPHQGGPLIPYGLPCVRELFRFLVSLTNPLDRHNSDVMIHMGLSLLTVALESGADHIPANSSLMCLVKDDMCKNLIFLLQSERLTLFAASVRVCFLLFESMRSHVKFQLEAYMSKLMEIVVSWTGASSEEKREMALESIVQLLRIPGLVTELYLNYDCDLYSSNVFEDLMKLLSKNAFPVSGLVDSVHLLSLDALLAVIDSIEGHCHHRILHSANAQEASTEDTNSREATPTSSASTTAAVTTTQRPSSTAPWSQTSPTASPGGGRGAGRAGKGRSASPRIRPNRMKLAEAVPTEQQLANVKLKKKLYHTGTEQFNVKPAKGIAFMQEHGLLRSPLDADEVTSLLRQNPRLDKKQIGEYVGAKKNAKIMEAFMRSFAFEDRRVDESLRMFLETFRLPGEAPVISYILEHFAEHWQKCNGYQFANADACFTLAYAIIMLNVDQHNTNAKKQNIPMTVQQFKANVKGCNGGSDFDQDMLEEVYAAVKNEEIVMPAEQTGVVKENYLWKVLLKRGNSSEGYFLHVATGSFDRDLFALVWGPTVAALSFVFDKSGEEGIVHRAVSGFRKCALIAAHYAMSDVFDNLVISLCKFTTLLSAPDSAEQIPIQFGSNPKAQLAARTVFGLAHRHGDILREGWRNILDCMLQLYRARLLPEVLVKVEDFLDPSGSICLVREETPALNRNDSGVLSSFYSYFSLADTPPQRGPSAEEQEAMTHARGCIEQCHVEQLVQESKFLRIDSLQELLKALVLASRLPEEQEAENGSHCDEDSAVFFFELLVKVVLQNRDRVAPFWQSIRDHIYALVVNANSAGRLVERAVVGLLRTAIRLLRREEVASQVLASLRLLLMMKPVVIHAVCQQVAFGLHDLLKTNAANIHSTHDWYTLFTLLEVTGAGAMPPPLMQAGPGVNVPDSLSEAGAQSDSEVGPGSTGLVDSRGYTSDGELYENKTGKKHEDSTLSSAGSWHMVSQVNKEDVSSEPVTTAPTTTAPPPPVNQYNIALSGELTHHDAKALLKSCETLAFLVRDAAHVTPHNFHSCVHCLRTFVEASINGGVQARQQRIQAQQEARRKQEAKRRRKLNMKKSKSSPSQLHMSDSEDDQELDSFHSLSIQLLDLMHTLHTRAASIFSSWAAEQQQDRNESDSPPIDAQAASLWLKCWCPLLQGIARLCCDTRKAVRGQALTYLQRALLVHDLQTLSPTEWENCFNKVLFPLLHLLLENINPSDPSGVEETRMRASTLLCKVFLQHLTPLLSLSTFTALWLTILDFMDKYMHAGNSDLLGEAIPESLKNMLLVMHTAGILSRDTGTEQAQLWSLTWERIDVFLPNLRTELFKPHETEPGKNVIDREPTPNADTAVTQASPAPEPRPLDSPRSQSPTQLSGSPQASQSRPDSPLTTPPQQSAASTPYILHPPLPSVASPRQAGHTSVPLILNPDLIAQTAAQTIPIIQAQTSQEKTSPAPAQQSVVKDY